ncbi:MAG: ATP-binding protein [Lachnospiraceae bacterium]|nr:ATP-binding protein [Lachnospiraceae bacterium]
MKIAFTGTHCTGKTTLLKDIEEILADKLKIHSVTEVARKIIEKGYPLNMDATVESYIHYINDQLNEENKLMQECDIFISDRTLLDPVAYAMVNSKLPRPYISEYFIEMMKNIWLLEKDRYDLYVYFPIEFALQYDGVRPEDEKYRRDIDALILSLLEQFQINYIKISGDRSERKKQLCDVIEKYKVSKK